MKIHLVFCAAVLALTIGCGGPKADQRTFPMQGQIQSIDPAKKSAVIKHEDIKGFMPGMTMAFKAGPDVLGGTRPGDLVTGTLVVGEVEVYLSKLAVTGHRALDEAAPLPADGSAIIQPGDSVRDAVLVDQDGQMRRFSGWRGHRLALTFVYTRCPLPQFCPLMNQHFRTVQAALARTPALADVRLLTMSLDPGYDTPQVLKPYALGAGADPARWTFLTAEPGAATDFMAQFGVINEPNPSNPADITHNLRTAIIGADGRLATVHTGNRWTPDELVADLTATPAPAN